MVSFLIWNKVNTNVADPFSGETPIFMFFKRKRKKKFFKILDLLIKDGAANPFHLNKKGKSFIYYCKKNLNQPRSQVSRDKVRR